MAVKASQSLFAVDSNFLLDLAAVEPKARQALDVIRKKAAASILTTVPTVLDELAYGATCWSHGDRELALTALLSLKDWGIQTLDLIPVGHGLVELAADRILSEGLLPPAEKNDAFVISEAALMDCAMLITSERHLLDIDPVKLRGTLKSRGLGEPSIKSPAQVVSMFGF